MVTYRSGGIRRFARTIVPAITDTARSITRTFTAPAQPEIPFPHHDPVGPRGSVLYHRVIDAVGLRQRITAARFSFVTQDAHGRPLTCTGAMFRTSDPFAPLIGFAPSTQGVAPHCDPSYTCTLGASPLDLSVAYEQPVINWFLNAGANVVVTDYPREPDTKTQLYCDHQAAAFSLIDAITAARTAFGCRGPLGLWGFSQGGGAVGAYLESREGEAPIASVVGAPPAYLDEVLRHVDGSIAAGGIAYYLGGLMASNSDARAEIESVLTDNGLRELKDNANRCTGGSVLMSGWRSTKDWTRSGQSLVDLIDKFPVCSAEITRLALGKAEPRGRVRLWGSLHDDVIPATCTDRLALAWPHAEYRVDSMPAIPGRMAMNHFVPYFRTFSNDAHWLLTQLR